MLVYQQNNEKVIEGDDCIIIRLNKHTLYLYPSPTCYQGMKWNKKYFADIKERCLLYIYEGIDSNLKVREVK